jgi:hypothetical protein
MNCLFICREHDSHNEKLIHPISLKQAHVPELRYVTVELHEGVGWMFTFLEDLQRYSQLEYFNIYGHMISGVIVSDVPRIAELRQWLQLTKSTNFTFRLKVEMRWLPDCEESLNAFLDEYRQVIGDDSLSIHSRTLLIRYPEMLLFNQLKTNATVSEEDDNSSNSSSSSKLMIDESVDENCEEVSIEIFDISKKYFYFFVDGCIRDGLYARRTCQKHTSSNLLASSAKNKS